MLPKPDGLIIRAAVPEDVDGITALSNLPGYRYGTMRLPFQTPQQTRHWFDGRGPDHTLLVGAIEDRIVASAGLHHFTGRRAHAAGIGMGVHDDYCGRGIGTAILGALVDLADNWLDLKRLELTVFADNHAAIRLYEKAGFEREGLLRYYALRAGAYPDCLTMARLHPRLAT